jgi:hypothetical protein
MEINIVFVPKPGKSGINIHVKMEILERGHDEPFVPGSQ